MAYFFMIVPNWTNPPGYVIITAYRDSPQAAPVCYFIRMTAMICRGIAAAGKGPSTSRAVLLFWQTQKTTCSFPRVAIY